MSEAAAIALRVVALAADIYPALASLLERVTSHPDFAGDAVAQQVRATLPEESECDRAAKTLRNAT